MRCTKWKTCEVDFVTVQMDYIHSATAYASLEGLPLENPKVSGGRYKFCESLPRVYNVMRHPSAVLMLAFVHLRDPSTTSFLWVDVSTSDGKLRGIPLRIGHALSKAGCACAACVLISVVLIIAFPAVSTAFVSAHSGVSGSTMVFLDALNVVCEAAHTFTVAICIIVAVSALLVTGLVSLRALFACLVSYDIFPLCIL